LDFVQSGILNTRKNNVSETGSVSILSLGEGYQCQWLRLALSKGPNSRCVPSLTSRRKQIQFPKRVF
jgi:hypothetical protein